MAPTNGFRPIVWANQSASAWYVSWRINAR